MNAACRVAALVSALVTSIPFASAQPEYPSRPVRIVHGFTAGGISDVLARAIGARLTTSMGQQVVVDVRSGAGTTIASDHVAKSPPDGYTLFLQDMTTHAINASLYRRLPYDSVRDFTPIGLIATSPLVLIVHPSLPVKSVKDLVALARKRPGEIAHGSSGNGTIVHLAAEMLKSMAGIEMVHVPYKGSPQLVTGLLGGEIAVSFATTPPVLPNVEAGKLRALAVTTPQRTDAAPGVPTMKEAGLKDFELVLYTGVLGPRGVPAAIVDRVNAEFVKAVQLPEIQKVYARVGAAPMSSTPETFAAHIKSEMAKLGKLVQLSGARID
ncbi:MAG TPA: tripartite tricarboxylate transporter substrate binding protein [Burkholderiales bacterium]|nr:tripartite tricarboxylate transporter substrate binding protein [Burkholderiales bacterium]